MRLTVVTMAFLIGAGSLMAAPLRELGRAERRWVDRTLARMTVEEKVGQMLLPVSNGSYKPDSSEEWARIEHAIRDLHVGGYHTFGGDPAGTAVLLERMQRLSEVPLLITADLEGGLGYVSRGATRLPLAMAIGATGNPDFARRAGEIAASEGRAVGIHVNYYPVVDVQNNPRNPIINIRSFGEDVESVSAMARAYIDGAQSAGQIATAKHFPGHGDVAQDSHLELPVLKLDRERLERIELPPFQAAIDSGVEAVMSAHIWVPAFEEREGIPSTLSRAVMTDLLRGEMGFEGLVFTDAMDMRGVSAHFEVGDATVRAIEAGADVVIFPPDLDVAHAAVVAAVRSGRLSEARLDTSVRRILEAKAKVGLHRGTGVDPLAVSSIVGSEAHRDAAQEMMDAAVTLVRNENGAVPLRGSEDMAVLHVNLLDRSTGWREGPVGNVFADELRRRFPRTVTVQIDDRSGAEEIAAVRKMAQLADAVVVNGFIRVAAYKGSIDMTPGQLELLRHMAGLEKPFVFTLFGSPYLLAAVPELPSYILTYDTHPAAERAAVRAITGEIPFRGKLPVSIPGLYPVGHGVAAAR
ncbi:MAG: glycoside hydrolase family 3 protein [Thermoanaerobaculia bacterium]